MMTIACRFVSSIERWGALLLFGAAIGLPNAVLGQTRPFDVNGISFPLIGRNYLEDSGLTPPGWTPIPVVIDQLKALGATDIKVTVSAGGYKSPTDNLPDSAMTAALNPPDEQIVAFIKALKAAGLRVILDPFVNIAFDPNGNLLDTVHPQPTDFKVWMAAFTSNMQHLADLGRQGGADRFTVITDVTQGLTYGTAHQDDWVAYMAKMREAFPGVLTSILSVAAVNSPGGNTSIDLTPRPILDALDEIGIGWFPQPITNTADPTLAQLIAGWRSTVNGVDSVAFLKGIGDKYGKPILIADIALHSFSGDNVRSSDIFDARIPLVADQQEQANEYDSFLYVMYQNKGDWLKGVVFDNWNRFPTDYTQTARFLNSAYGENIRGKLAETVLLQWYNGARTGPGATTVFEYYNATLDHYFITWLPDEIAKLDAGTVNKGWTRTGSSFPTYMTPKTGSSPVCRFYIPPGLGDSHFFGRGTTECDATAQKNPTFVLEDPAFMQMYLPALGVCAAGTTEVYRVFDNRPDANHRYMTDKAIRDQMVAKGWIAEGDGPNLVVMCAPQ